MAFKSLNEISRGSIGARRQVQVKAVDGDKVLIFEETAGVLGELANSSAAAEDFTIIPTVVGY